MKSVCIGITLLLLSFSHVHAQHSLKKAKETVKFLTSDSLSGRGYVDSGELLAANYIAGIFDSLGVKTINGSYFQRYAVPVNTFPGKVELSINGKLLQTGIDYLIDPSSPTVYASYKARNATFNELEQSLPRLLQETVTENQILILDEAPLADIAENRRKNLSNIYQFLKYGSGAYIPPTLILTDEKLTWTGSTYQRYQPSVIVDKSKVEFPIEDVDLNIEAVFYSEYPTQNVIGYIEGERSDSVLVLMAHYDHFGKMGSAIFPGANDNASGVAMLLSLAEYYSKNTPPYSTYIIAFGAEEIGLLGSKYFVNNAPFDLNRVKFFLNFDLAGTGDEGIQVVNGSVYEEEFGRLQNLNSESNLLLQVKIRGAACNSDHCNFDQLNIPGFYIYTLGGIRAYHDVYDKFETLPFTEFEDYFKLLTLFIDDL